LTTYLAALILLFSATFFFSAKTEQARVLTIQKPLVINQERKTPAYYVYQQSQNLLQKKSNENIAASTFLSQESVRSRFNEIQLSELKLTKYEYAQIYNRLENKNRFAQTQTAQPAVRQIASNPFDLEKVVFNEPAPKAPSVFDSFEQEPALSPEKKWATLRGKFELRDGVGIVDHITNIRRVEEGQTRELGRIDLNAGTYSIDIESPNGVLIAQIKDQNGQIIGEDRKAIINLQNKGGYFEGPFIRVGRPASLAVNNGNETPSTPAPAKPSSSAPATTVASSKGSGSTAAASTFTANGSGSMVASIFDGQKMLDSALQDVPNVSKFSSTIARLDDPLHVYASLTTIRMTGENSQTSQFTQKWLDGSLSYISDTLKIELSSPKAPVLIGRVMIDGQPVAGAQAQISGQIGFQAIYLDEFMIPSTKLTETSTNGFFMFVNMNEDTYEVIASKQNKMIGSQVFVAESSRIAYQNILTLSSVQTKTIRSFHAFTSENVPADVLTAGVENVIELVDAYGMIRTNVDNNVSNYYVRSPNTAFADINYTTSGHKDYVHIPMIPATWLNQLATNKGLSEMPDTGVIIGFTMNLNYTAYLAAEKYDPNNIAYFDMYGRPTAQPVVGGGFALFNVPVGAREVVLQDMKTEQLYSQVFQVRKSQIYVSHFSE
jgi:hypothetical protein